MFYKLFAPLLLLAIVATAVSGCVRGNPALPDPSITVTSLTVPSGPTVIVPNP